MKDNRTVNRVLEILELISRHNEGMTLGEIYRELEIPKATAHDILQTLYKADAIYYKDPRIKNYVVGSRMYAIGSVYTKNSNFIESAEFELKKLADKYGKIVFMTKRINNKFVYVYKYQPSNSRIITPEEIGTISKDFTTNNVGMCYSVFDHLFINNYQIENKEDILKKGYVETAFGNDDYIYSVAAPIYNFENRVCGVISSSDFYNVNTNNDEFLAEFIDISHKISQRLGYL